MEEESSGIAHEGRRCTTETGEEVKRCDTEGKGVRRRRRKGEEEVEEKKYIYRGNRSNEMNAFSHD